MLTSVDLSNGEEVQVKRLGLFEIDDIARSIPGAYSYTVHLMGGDDYEMIYDIEDAVANPPEEPAIPLEETEAGLPEYYQWQDWLRYQEALAHQTKMYEGYAAYCESVAAYIRANCLPDGVTIETAEDWEAVYNAALCPQVSIDDIRTAMSLNFGATWGGKELLDALATIDGSMGEYISTKVWETDLMIKLGETEVAYTERGVKERARMIAALKIPQFFGILESDRAAKDMKSRGS